jgi:hypothetical protein
LYFFRKAGFVFAAIGGRQRKIWRRSLIIGYSVGTAYFTVITVYIKIIFSVLSVMYS